jgi:hypothetical protein
MPNRFDERSAIAGGADPTIGAVQLHLDNVLARIPGYKGYRDKESRRDADRAIRDELAGRLDAVAARVERVARDLADRRRLRDVSTVDTWVQSLRHLANRIRNASYGYGGVFGDRDVDARALEQMHQFDESMLAELQRLDDPVEELEAAVVADGDIAAAVRRGTDATDSLAVKFDSRDSIVSSGDSKPEPLMRELLSPPPGNGPPAAWQLDAGDAISVLGDDFLVDARLHVEGQDVSFRLFRLGEQGDKQWLFVPANRSVPMAVLREVERIPTEGLQVDYAGSGQSQLAGPGGASSPQPVEYRLMSSRPGEGPARAVVLDRSDEQMNWTGQSLSEEEITIFGASGTHT